MIALVDYGAGNLTSVRKALSHLRVEFVTPPAAADLDTARGIIVPGVGHFDRTRTLDDAWRTAIRSAIDRGAALFGICLGMQWLFEGSAEAPGLPGLAFFAGTCDRLPGASTQNRAIDPTPFLKVPHVGWNTLVQPRPSALMAEVPQDAQVYFTHSYAAPLTAATAATTTYGTTFTSAVERGRVAGVQFHPEKSGDVGLRVLENWLHAL